MSPVPLTRKQGDTWEWTVTWSQPIPGTNPPRPDPARPIDITGYTAKVQIWRAASDNTGTALLALTSSPAAGLTVDGPTGKVTVQVSPTLTAAIPPGRWVWECEITRASPLDVQTLAEGPFTVTPQLVV